MFIDTAGQACKDVQRYAAGTDAILKLYSEQWTVNNHIKNTVVITQKIICRISPDCTELKTDETWNTVIVTQMCRPL